LTTKFTQSTEAASYELRAYGPNPVTDSSNAPCKLYSATLLLARLDMFTAAPTTDPSLRSG